MIGAMHQLPLPDEVKTWLNNQLTEMTGRAAAKRADTSYLCGKRVLVTGAGGSIGAELVRQLAPLPLAELVMLDRDESALHSLQLALHGRALLISDELALCSIRDREALHQVFAAHRPQVVFHAAALKHLPLLQKFPAEAYKTNTLGTANVLEAAQGAERFVNISTDKAAQPTSALGCSKQLAERLTGHYGKGKAYASVRFGNLLASRGSVVHSLYYQIMQGGPVTITDPKVERFFMSLPQACNLMLEAGGRGRNGQVLVMDMGKQVPVLTLAQKLMDYLGRSVPVEYTGLREGEKLSESLFGPDEHPTAGPTKQLSALAVPALAPADL